MATKKTDLEEIQNLSMRIAFLTQEVANAEHERSKFSKEKEAKEYNAAQKTVDKIRARIQELTLEKTNLILKL